MNGGSLLFFIFTIALILILDQGTKFLAQTYMYEGQSIPIVQDVFHLTYILNPGAAFGILAHKTAFFVVTSTLVIGLIFFLYRKVPKEKLLLRLGLALQVAGAGGNLLDRLRTGMVVDFFDFRVWPVFNVADVAIIIGVAILLYEIIRYEKKEVAE